MIGFGLTVGPLLSTMMVVNSCFFDVMATNIEKAKVYQSIYPALSHLGHFDSKAIPDPAEHLKILHIEKVAFSC